MSEREEEQKYVPVSEMNFDNMTVDEILAAVEQEEERLRKKKEDVFRRVLHSLTDGQELSSEAAAVHDSATIAFYESKRRREEAKLKADARKRDQEERLAIEREREQLRRRFEQDSEDAKGINPILDSEAKFKEDGDFSYDWQQQQSVTVNLEAIFGNNHSDIDEFLDELEEEFESQAMGKEAVPSSDLDRLFKMLDEAAATNHLHSAYTSASPIESSPTAQPAVEHDVNFARFQEEIAAYSLTLPNGSKSVMSRVTETVESDNRMLTYKTTTATSTAPSENNNEKKAGASGRGIRSEYRESVSTATAAATSDKGSDVARGGANTQDDDEDDDDLFMASRAKMKSASALASSHLKKPPSETKEYIPVITPAARAKLAASVDITVSVDAEHDDESNVSDNENEESEEAEEEEREIINDRLSEASSPNDEISIQIVESVTEEMHNISKQDIIVEQPTSVFDEVPTTKAEEPITSKPEMVTPSKKPLIEVISSSPTSLSTAGPSSGSLLSGSLLGQASSRPVGGKGKGKVVMTNTRGKQAPPTSGVSSSADDIPKTEEESHNILSSPSKQTSPEIINKQEQTKSPNKSTVMAETHIVSSSVAEAEKAIAVEPEIIQPPIHIPTSIELEHIENASLLPVFPWTHLAQKSSGMMIQALWTESFGKKDGNEVDINCELQDLIAVSLHLEENAPDYEIFSLLEWVLRQVGDAMSLVGFLRGMTDDEKQTHPLRQMYHFAIFRKNSEDVSIHYVQQVTQVTKLQDILPMRANFVSHAATTNNRNPTSSSTKVYLSDAVSLYEFYDMPERVMNQLVAAHRSQLSDTVSLPTGILPSQVHVAPVVFRPESLFSDSTHKGHSQSVVAKGALSSLTQQAEAQGLRVLGVRLVHFTHQLTQELKKILNIDLPLLPSASLHLSPIFVVSFVSMHGQAVADILRGIIGPDDPTLARKTDPQSIRAIFGGQKREENVVISLSYAKEKLLKEVSYWFGPRSSSQGYSMLLFPKVSTIEFGVRMVQYHQEQPNKSQKEHLESIWTGDDVAKIQHLVLSSVVGQLEEHGHLRSMQSMSLSDFATRMFRVKPIYVFKSKENVGEMEAMSGAQCLLWRLESTVSVYFLQAMWQKLVTDIGTTLQAITKMHSLHMNSLGVTCYMTTSQADNNTTALQQAQAPQGSQYFAQQILSKLSVYDYRSHEDVGLSDTIVLSMQLQAMSLEDIGKTTVDTKSMRTSTMCRFLPMLFSRLPPSVHAHVVGAITTTDGNTLYLVLRGYQIIETIEDIVRDMQNQYQQLITSQIQQFLHLLHAHPANLSEQQRLTNQNASIIANHGSFISIVRGRRALEKILQLFSLNTLYIQPAVEDIRRYVPNSYQFVPDDLFTNQTCLEQYEQHAQTSVLAKAVAHALFPPGVFTAMGVLVLPIQPSPTLFQNKSTANNNAHQLHQQEMNHMLLMMRYQVATLSRLHKEDFTVLAMQATEALSPECYERLCRENFEMYIEEYRSAGVSWEDVLERFHLLEIASAASSEVEQTVRVESPNVESVMPPAPPLDPVPPLPKQKGETAADCIGNEDLGKTGPELFTSESEKRPDLPPVPSVKKVVVPIQRIFPAQSSFGSSSQEKAKPPAALIVLVARKSALLKLRHSVGPTLDEGVASDKYPRSLTSLFASLFPGQVFANSGDIETQGSVSPKRSPKLPLAIPAVNGGIERYPFLLPSLTCATADWMVKKYLPAHRDVFVSIQQEKANSQKEDSTEEQLQDYFRIAENLFGIDIPFQERLASIITNGSSTLPSASVINGRKITPTRNVSVVLKNEVPELFASKTSLSIIQTHEMLAPSSPDKASKVSLMDSVDTKTVDIAGVVLTSALIAHHGLDTILDVIHQEGLVVVNSVTTKLTMAMVKILTEAAGMSSLTLKPSNQTMLTGPVVVLGLYGPMHAFVRLKSFQLHSTRSSLLNSTGNIANGSSSTTSLWTLPNGESGVLASSSSRLARQLYGLCFDRVLFHSQECPFVVVEEISADKQ